MEQLKNNKKYHIKTWGCQMNVYDSQRIGEILLSLGYQETEDLTESDIVILNTCHIREKATEKVYSEIGRLSKLKERRQEIGSNLIIAVSGCVAQAEGEEIQKRSKFVDIVFGPQTWHKLKEMIDAVNSNNKYCNTSFPVEEKFDQLPEILDKNRVKSSSSFVVVQEGCDKFCTYCVVPFTRGAEYSRPTFQILSEVKNLVNAGAKEITLLGQNVSSYNGEHFAGKKWSLGRLIKEIAEIEGLERIRYTTSYPTEIDDELISAHKNIDKLIPFLHLPIQSGSNKILKLMNRKHTNKDYLNIIEKIKSSNPKMAFSSDFIVGFPEEDDNDFKDTLSIINQVGFIQSYAFIYSKRPGTRAFTYEDTSLTTDILKERLKILQDVLTLNQYNFNKNTVGSEFKVLLDREGRKENQIVGKSPYMQTVHINNLSKDYLGKIVNVKILESLPYSLRGELI